MTVVSRAGRYGIDAPYALAGLCGAGVMSVAAAAVLGRNGFRRGAGGVARAALGISGGLLLATSAIYLQSTLSGKFRVWQRLLDELDLRGDEQLLDLGCGRGAVLLAAAHRLPGGRAHGVDIWRQVDQSGNAESVTAANALAEGVDGRVELHTADMTELPFPDASFDVITSSLAIHNIPAVEARHRALDEARRVLRPGGRLVLVDLKNIRDYADHLRGSGFADVSVRGLGPLVWFGAASVLTATRGR